jgi:hypothetical protein
MSAMPCALEKAVTMLVSGYDLTASAYFQMRQQRGASGAGHNPQLPCARDLVVRFPLCGMMTGGYCSPSAGITSIQAGKASSPSSTGERNNRGGWFPRKTTTTAMTHLHADALT